MAKLVLKYEDRVLREIPMGQGGATIGRLPTNSVVIDNPAVSGQHARILLESGQHVLEDLNSRNGTFVNEKPVSKHTLREGDVVRVGKHTLVFYSVGMGEAADPAAGPALRPATTVQEFGGTVMLDTKQQKDLMTKLAQSKSEAAVVAAPARHGTLTLVSGRTDQRTYTLEAQTTLVGKSTTAQVRLKGWFKPKVAAAITRKGSGYMLTPLSGKTRVNGQPLRQGYELKAGDVLQISGATLQFNLTE